MISQNMTPFISEIAYSADSSTIFSAIRNLPFACWLDSGKPNSHSGRYDIITAQPSQRWVTHGNTTSIFHYCYDHTEYNRPNQQYYEQEADHHSRANPFDLLKIASQALHVSEDNDQSQEQENPLPFYGGIISYFAYELGYDLHHITPDIEETEQTAQLPDMVAGLYDWAIIQDHELHKSYFVSLNQDKRQNYINKARLESLIADDQGLKTPKFAIRQLQQQTSKESYFDKINQIHQYILNGDCYQVNLSQSFHTPYEGDPYEAYIDLRNAMASPFSAFMDLGGQTIMSLSPERLLQIHQQSVLTQPIKGTMARHKNKEIDQKNADTLLNSEKNRAENLMIVDLLRNDLGKNCIPGSIDVPALFELKSYPNVHHLVSSVTGRMDKDKTALDVLKGCFPGGSITGAPKKRAMEIIRELEDHKRSIYCGSIAYINHLGDMDSNITIRTIACDGENLYCWGGGGIVADSEAKEEYQESLTKIDTILDVLTTFQPNKVPNA